MIVSTIITFIIFACLLFWYSIMLSYNLYCDHENYEIASQKDLYKKLIIFFVLFLFLLSVFTIRIMRQGYSLNLQNVLTKISTSIMFFSVIQLIGLSLIFFLLLLFWLLLMLTFFAKVRKSAVSVFIYLYQYNRFRNICYFINNLHGNYVFFLLSIVKRYTKNPKIFGIARVIWPLSIQLLEKYIYFGLLPFIIYFDFHLHNGVLTKIFYVLPWFYVYWLFRKGFSVYFALNNDFNNNMTYKLYGFK